MKFALPSASAVAIILLLGGCSPVVPSVPTVSRTAESTPTPTSLTATRAPYDPSDPATWSTRRLVAQTIFDCVSQSAIASESRSVAAGLGGVILMGGAAPVGVQHAVRQLVAHARGNVPPIIGSDEEGGSVQRLAREIYPLPSAAQMGTWDRARITETARRYGSRMAKLGVTLDFAPVADLAIPGHFIADSGRSFGKTPRDAARGAIAWASGLAAAGVAPVIKHWPGHGRAGDTHTSPGIIPPLRDLERTDLVPFEDAIAAGFTTVMVGHLTSRGLTEANTPASRSPKALSYLRSEIGADGVIITDSLVMEASLSGVNHRLDVAAVRSLAAGADVALVCNGPSDIVSKVIRLLHNNGLTRADLITKVTRILQWKRHFGIVPAG